MGCGGRAVNALEIDAVSHWFGRRRVLHDVSFAVAPGGFTVLLGPNGAGKTTLLSLATRLYDTRRGAISIYGHQLDREPSRALAQLGIVFQLPTLDLDLTVEENLRYHASLYGLSRRGGEEQARSELVRLGLSERASEPVRALSGGLRRRVEIARALLHGPRLLLLDEATAGVDLATRQLILAHVRSLCSIGVGVLWATHLVEEVQEDDALVVLDRGAVVWRGPPASLRTEQRATTTQEAVLALTRRPA